MAYLLLRIMINALSIAGAVRLIDGLTFTGEWWKMIIIGAIFGSINAVIKPVVKFFTLPFLVLTLGLFTLIINALMLGLTAYLSDSFALGFHISSFWAAFKGALFVSIISTVLTWLTGLGKIVVRKKHEHDGWEQ